MKPNYRRCLSCRRVAPKEAFRRIVRVHPSRQVQLDQGMGRSAYLCPQLSCLERAQQKNRLGRALKLRTSVPEHIYQKLREDLDKPPLVST
ncbi:MAG: YlxR family protein [Microcystaceae cyanobacterium]